MNITSQSFNEFQNKNFSFSHSQWLYCITNVCLKKNPNIRFFECDKRGDYEYEWSSISSEYIKQKAIWDDSTDCSQFEKQFLVQKSLCWIHSKIQKHFCGFTFHWMRAYQTHQAWMETKPFSFSFSTNKTRYLHVFVSSILLVMFFKLKQQSFMATSHNENAYFVC